jgi:hypothetical protein
MKNEIKRMVQVVRAKKTVRLKTTNEIQHNQHIIYEKERTMR